MSIIAAKCGLIWLIKASSRNRYLIHFRELSCKKTPRHFKLNIVLCKRKTDFMQVSRKLPTVVLSLFYHHIMCNRAMGSLTDKVRVSTTPLSSLCQNPIPDIDTAMRNEAREIFNHSVNSVLPHQMIGSRLNYNQSNSVLKVADQDYNLHSNVYVVGFGKAVLGMARSVEDCIGEHIVRGVISIPLGAQKALEKEGKEEMLLHQSTKIRVMAGAANNLPDDNAMLAATEISSLVRDIGKGDLLIVLISGGGSALLPAPKPPVTLPDILAVTRLMSRAGATIMQLNAVRKQIESLKGGGLALLAQPAKVISLILSDVVGDSLDVIASGPTVPDHSTPGECLNHFTSLGIMGSVPHSIIELLHAELQNQDSSSSHVPHSAPSSEHGKDFNFTFNTNVHEQRTRERDCNTWMNVQNLLVGTNKIACEAACKKSSLLGYLPYLLSTELDGEAQRVGRMFALLAHYMALCSAPSGIATLAEDLKQAEEVLAMDYKISNDKLQEIKELAHKLQLPEHKGVCIIAGGETTVTVRGQGKGGRNQEMALVTALELDQQFSSFRRNLALPFQDNLVEKETHMPSSFPFSPVNVVFLSAGTDGQDGPTSAAGGVVSLGFTTRVQSCGIDILDCLEKNDSHTLLTQVDGGSNLVITGLTGTNVMDVHLLLLQRADSFN